MDNAPKANTGLRERLHDIIFEADTKAGKAFDVVLLILILASVLNAGLESVDHLYRDYRTTFRLLEWGFTILFTIEYMLRIYCVLKPWKYITSFFGIIDLLAILPTYLSLLFIGTQYLIVIRSLRLLRVFRIFRLVNYMTQGQVILAALRNSRDKIILFLFFMTILVTIVGSMLYVVEGSTNEGFSSIPRSVYWAIVTITTVGYGDISPQTNLGQMIAAMVMIMGYALIAVPTGIVSAEFIRKHSPAATNIACRNCGREGHDANAKYCKYCSYELEWE